MDYLVDNTRKTDSIWISTKLHYIKMTISMQKTQTVQMG